MVYDGSPFVSETAPSVVELVHAGGYLYGLGERKALIRPVTGFGDTVDESHVHGCIDIFVVPTSDGHIVECDATGAGVGAANEHGRS